MTPCGHGVDRARLACVECGDLPPTNPHLRSHAMMSDHRTTWAGVNVGDYLDLRRIVSVYRHLNGDTDVMFADGVTYRTFAADEVTVRRHDPADTPPIRDIDTTYVASLFAEAEAFGGWLASEPSPPSPAEVPQTSPPPASGGGNGAVAGLRADMEAWGAKLVTDVESQVLAMRGVVADVSGRLDSLEFGGPEWRSHVMERLAAVERWGAEHAADHYDTKLATRIAALEQGAAARSLHATLRATALEARIEALERPGPVAPLLGEHKEALAERAAVVAWLRAEALTREHPAQHRALRYAADTIENGNHRVKP